MRDVGYVARPDLGGPGADALSHEALKFRLGGVPWFTMMSSHMVTQLHHAALVGFDLR